MDKEKNKIREKTTELQVCDRALINKNNQKEYSGFLPITLRKLTMTEDNLYLCLTLLYFRKNVTVSIS